MGIAVQGQWQKGESLIYHADIGRTVRDSSVLGNLLVPVLLEPVREPLCPSNARHALK